jgi:glycosyltransferase involved in cell wall biosynthesis
MNPLITIIIPTYNREEFIFDTIASVLNQTFQNWECIVVDDHSTDECFEFIKGISDLDKRIKLLKRPFNKTKGANACRNIGVNNASGKYLIFLDSDDILKKDCLETRLNYFINNQDMDLLIFSMGYFNKISDGFYEDESRSFFNVDLNHLIEEFIFGKKLPWNVTRPIFKRKQVINICFNEQINNFQDDEFNIRYITKFEPKYLCIDITDCYYRVDEISKNKYNNQLGYQNIVNSLYEYYNTIFNALSNNSKLKYKIAIISKFEKDINQFVVSKLNLTILKKTLNLIYKQLDLNFITYISLFCLIYVNYYLKDKKGYFFIRNKISGQISK